jgi:hypothetical protein
MKSANKIFLGLATATAILAPLVPKSININVNMSSEAPAISAKVPKRPQVEVEAQCDLVSKTIRDGRQDCEYKCRGSQTTIHKAYYGSNGVCFSPITEKILVSKK